MKKTFLFLFIAFVSLLFADVRKSVTEQSSYTCTQFDVISEDANHLSFGNDLTISEAGLIYEWRLEPRKTPEKLMLAKAFLESNNHINIFRLEKKLNMVSCGLFQILKPKLEVLPIRDQLKEYDIRMFWCMNKAQNDIKKAIFYYNSPYANYYEAEFVIKTYNYFIN